MAMGRNREALPPVRNRSTGARSGTSMTRLPAPATSMTGTSCGRRILRRRAPSTAGLETSRCAAPTFGPAQVQGWQECLDPACEYPGGHNLNRRVSTGRSDRRRLWSLCSECENRRVHPRHFPWTTAASTHMDATRTTAGAPHDPVRRFSRLLHYWRTEPGRRGPTGTRRSQRL